MDAATLSKIGSSLMARDFGRALKQAEEALTADPDDLLALAHRGIAFLELGEVEKAETDLRLVVEKALKDGQNTTAAFAEQWLGYTYNRRGERERAVAHFETAADLVSPSSDLCAAICQTYVQLGELEKAREWGQRSLRMRAEEGKCDEGEQVSRTRPRPFDPDARARNIISFSLFGEDPFYQECAVTMARSAFAVFPEFTCRFYCGEEIPEQVKRLLATTGAQVMQISRSPSADGTPFDGLFWRFLAFDDPNVDIVLVRDVDSPFSPRERAAIDLWLASEAPFFTMRDHINHAEPLMAGMWGGFTGLLPRLGSVLSRGRANIVNRYADQAFLRQFVWPRIRHATLSIDSVYEIENRVDFPKAFPKRGTTHVGAGWRREQILGPGATGPRRSQAKTAAGDKMPAGGTH